MASFHPWLIGTTRSFVFRTFFLRWMVFYLLRLRPPSSPSPPAAGLHLLASINGGVTADAAVQSSAAVGSTASPSSEPARTDASWSPSRDPTGAPHFSSAFGPVWIFTHRFAAERFPDAPSRHDAAVALVSPAVRVHAHGECLRSDACVLRGRSASSPLLSVADVRFYAQFFLQFDICL